MLKPSKNTNDGVGNQKKQDGFKPESAGNPSFNPSSTPEQLNDLEQQLKDLRGNFENLYEEFSESKKEMESEYTDFSKRFNEKLEKSSQNQLQTLGLFIGLFTFISIQFQIFSNANNSTVIALSLIFSGSLAIFLTFFLHLNFGKRAKDIWSNSIFVWSLAVIILGLCLYIPETKSMGDCMEIKRVLSGSKVLIDEDGQQINRKIELLCDKDNL